MIIWAILGFALVVLIVIWYWYSPEKFKVHPEKKYPENYGKHQDPHQYKGYR
jgi:O-antigen/teichoic acid export membrane protein